MGIFSRLTDIVNSNINALLDRAEDPEKMVRLIIQEMEETLVEVRTATARAIADRKELSRRKEWLDREILEWETKAKIALGKERDDLARAALVEKSRVIKEATQAEAELAHLNDALDKYAGDVGALQQKIADAKARQKLIIMRGRTAQTRMGVRRHLSTAQVDDAMSRFEHYERKIDDLEGQVEAYDVGKKTLSDQIAELEAGDEIEAELARLKSTTAADKH